jgi:hypothetical protein
MKQILAHAVGSNWTVIPQGSFVQGLQLIGSDLDLVLLDGTDRWRLLNRRRNADELESAVRRITRAQWEGFPIRISVIQKIYSARVPLVRLRITLPSSNQQIQVDMCFGDPSRGLCDQFVYRMISQVSECELFVMALKIWANKRGICETHTGGISCFAIVLLAIYQYRSGGVSFKGFFQLLLSLRARPNETVSVECMQIQQRPMDGVRDFIHVAVPCRPTENAARCTQLSVWIRKIAPEANRAISIMDDIPQAKREDFDFVIKELLTRTDVVVKAYSAMRDHSALDRFNSNHRYSEADTISDSSSMDSGSGWDVADDSDVQVIGETVGKKVPVEIETTHAPSSSSSSASSVDSDQLVKYASSGGANSQPVIRMDPRLTQTGPITIHECEECNYFAFNKNDLATHYYAIHKFPRGQNRSDSEDYSNKFKIPRKFKNQVGYQVPNTDKRKPSPPPRRDSNNYRKPWKSKQW